MAEHYQLKCRECGKLWAMSRAPSATSAFAGSKSLTTWTRRAAVLHARISRRDPPIVALQRTSPPSGRLPKYTPDRLYAVSGGRHLSKAARNAKSLHQKTMRMFPYLSFKDRVVAVALAPRCRFGIQGGELLLNGNLANAVARRPRAKVSGRLIFIRDLEPRSYRTLVFARS